MRIFYMRRTDIPLIESEERRFPQFKIPDRILEKFQESATLSVIQDTWALNQWRVVDDERVSRDRRMIRDDEHAARVKKNGQG
jgi:hypothetical protein